MKAIHYISLLATLLIGSTVVQADCFEEAAEKFKVDSNLMRFIAEQESGMKADAIGLNKNSKGKVVSEDLGLMQINSWHLKRLAKYGITKEKLLSDACTNIHVGAMILSENIKQYGNTWEAVGAYNAKSQNKRKSYAWKIYRRYQGELL